MKKIAIAVMIVALALSLMTNALGQPEFPGITMTGGNLKGAEEQFRWGSETLLWEPPPLFGDELDAVPVVVGLHQGHVTVAPFAAGHGDGGIVEGEGRKVADGEAEFRDRRQGRRRRSWRTTFRGHAQPPL